MSGVRALVRGWPWPSLLLAALLFLLSADLLFIRMAGVKFKYGYFLVLAAWLFEPRAMAATVAHALRRVPRLAFVPLLPLAISVATSVNVVDSLAWTAWLAFDMLTIATVYAFLHVHAFSDDQIRQCATWSLGLIALVALAQFTAIYVLHRPILTPQEHFGVYRINGLAGWPHFLNIFSFLLLPIVLMQRRLSWPTRAVLIMLAFVLVQSTAKTGWVLFAALGAILFCLHRRTFVRGYLLLLLPATLVALWIPIPPLTSESASVSGGEKVVRFAADLDLTQHTTSGTDRMLISRMGLEVWSKHPWFGVGPRAFDDYVFTRFDHELPGVNKRDANGMVNAKNENIYVEWLAECGALFTLGFAAVLLAALWVRRWHFRSRLHLGAWASLVLYFCISGQVSQNGLLTMTYAIFGVYFYARDPGRHLHKPGCSSAEAAAFPAQRLRAVVRLPE